MMLTQRLLMPLGDQVMPDRALAIDRDECRKIGSCGVGRKALYLGGWMISRRYYIPWSEVERVFKRVAMSAGGFSGRGVFGSMAYLVVQYGKNREKKYSFKHESEVDALLTLIEQEHPEIPTHSAKAARKLAEAEAQERARFLEKLTPEGETALETLRRAKACLEEKPELGRGLTTAARQKRVVDRMKPWVLVMGAVMAFGGTGMALYGVFSVMTGSSVGWYFLLVGGALFFFAMSANIVPGRWTSKKNAQKLWDDAVAEARAFIDDNGISIPPQYAHPVVLERMIRVVREGRAQSTDEALEVVKADLRALNSAVTVSQKEHDEVVEVKPLFLVSDYK